MDYFDVLEVLLNRGTVQRVQVFGRVMAYLPFEDVPYKLRRLPVSSNFTGELHFILIDVVGIRFEGDAEWKRVKGSLVALTTEAGHTGHWVIVRNRTRNQYPTIRSDPYNDPGHTAHCVTLGKEDDRWVLIPNILQVVTQRSQTEFINDIVEKGNNEGIVFSNVEGDGVRAFFGIPEGPMVPKKFDPMVTKAVGGEEVAPETVFEATEETTPTPPGTVDVDSYYEVFKAEVEKNRTLRSDMWQREQTLLQRELPVVNALIQQILGYVANIASDIHRKFGPTKTGRSLLMAMAEFVGIEKPADLVEEISLDPQAVPSCTTSQAAFNDPYKVVGAFLKEVLGVGLQVIDRELIETILGNPYLWGLSSGSLIEADKVYMAFPEQIKLRTDLRDLLIVNENLVSEGDNRATLIDKHRARTIKYPWGFHRGDAYPYRDVELVRALVPTFGSVDYNNTFRGSMAARGFTAPPGTVERLEELGLATIIENEVISSVYLEMELYIYEKLKFMSESESGVTDEHIQAAVSSYEESKGFSLEPQQCAGVDLVKTRAGVLTGQAGSGKTTVSEVFVSAIKEEDPEAEIYFAAPTGKAARRMKEVLGGLGDVKTIHSLFRIGLGTSSPLGPSIESVAGSMMGVIYIFDEMAMCTTSLLYHALRCIEDTTCRVYFLGDVKQLPPIGKGTPFNELLKLIPSVELGVSKRAAEGSGINKNCDIINQHSSQASWIDNVSLPDFMLTPCKDNELVATVSSVVREEINRFGPDGVYVATPYSHKDVGWSSKRLNPVLQDIFLPQGKPLFTSKNRVFYQGARVIHTTANIYGKLRYRHTVYDGIHTFTQVASAGIANGDVGVLVGIVDKDNSVFEYDEKAMESLDLAGHKVFDDEDASGTKYVMVEFDDVDIDEKVIVLYPASTTSAGWSEEYGEVLRGKVLGYLDLAYALSVHKLQGSQSLSIVIPISSTDNTHFFNRNMLYTAVSRAQEKVTVIGSCLGPSSTMANARRSNSSSSVRSVLALLSGNADV